MQKNGRKKIKIAMVCDPIGDYKAGAIISAVRFAEKLQKRGHHVIFIGSRSKKDPVDNIYMGMSVYRFRSLPLPRSSGWRLAFPTKKELKDIWIKEKIDIVHIILPMTGAIVAVKAAKELGIKIVAHSHSQPENLFMDVPKFLGRSILYDLWNKYLAWLYSKAELIIYPSEMGYELLHHLTEKNKKYAVISNGVDIETYKPKDAGDFYERFNIPTDTINLVYVGRLYPEKSVDTLIRAMPHVVAINPKTHLIIVGMGYLKPKLEAITKTLGMSSVVTSLALNDEDKILAYNAGNIFVSPSLAELEGMTVLEAMACGKPIIVPNAQMNAARYFVSNNGLLFETANEKDLAEKILTIITDSELCKKMGETSLSLSKKYGINQSVKKLEQVYNSVLS